MQNANQPQPQPQIISTAGRKSTKANRNEKWERFTDPEEVHVWLDNLHLLYQHKVALNGEGATKTWASRNPTVGLGVAGSTDKKRRGRPKKIVVNRLKPFLKHFTLPREALKFLPMFDDIVTGAVRLDAGGNTRPLSKTMMVWLLQVVAEVSTEAIQATKGCSKRHAQRIGQCLRIVESMAFRVATDHWKMPDGDPWSDLE